VEDISRTIANAGLLQSESHTVMGSDEDPSDGGAVAGAVFGAVFIYIVRRDEILYEPQLGSNARDRDSLSSADSKHSCTCGKAAGA